MYQYGLSTKNLPFVSDTCIRNNGYDVRTFQLRVPWKFVGLAFRGGGGGGGGFLWTSVGVIGVGSDNAWV